MKIVLRMEEKRRECSGGGDKLRGYYIILY